MPRHPSLFYDLMPPRPKRLCACGCTLYVTRKVELGHLNGQRSALLAANILSQNRSFLRRHKQASKLKLMSPSRHTGKQELIGHPTPARRLGAFSSRKASEDPSSETGEPEVPVTQLEDLSESPRWSSPIPLLPDADGCHGDQYGLSTQRRSHRITERVERIGRVRWGTNHVQFIEREEREEEENPNMEDEEDGMGHDDDELEDEDMPFAEPGQEGISVWDLLGEGFLKEVTELGWLLLN
jgi:hypothetical protein